MDWQPIIIAVIGSTALTQAVNLIGETDPKRRKLKRRLLEWEEWGARIRRWLLTQSVDTTDMPKPPEPE
ncbi:hypothetical protein U6G28_02685 [Actinomycetaceae bacterium MB13-C1-2]|nr:hypothetical protein U6G28_02685 [Actinomycetaceae bacterium MB13-C1-2]